MIVDAPPLGAIIDAAEIAKSCDGTLIVVNYDGVRRQELVKVKEHVDARLKDVEEAFYEIRPEGSWGFYKQVCESDPVAYLKKIKDKLNC